MSGVGAAATDVTYTRESFIARFGALVGNEKELDDEAINAKGQELDARYQLLQSDSAQEFFQDVPVLDPDKLSFSEKYRLFRGEPFQAMYKQVRVAYRTHECRVSALVLPALDPENPLQNLSDRARRISSSYEEFRLIAKGAEDTYWKINANFYLSDLERLIFTVVSFVHSFFETPFDFYDETQTLLRECQQQHDRYFSEKEAVFQTRRITFQGKDREVDIAGDLDQKSSAVRFMIHNHQYRDAVLGEIHLVNEENTSNLVIDRFYNRCSDPEIDKLLTQIALEVLQRERGKQILINTSTGSQETREARRLLGWGDISHRAVQIGSSTHYLNNDGAQMIVLADKLMSNSAAPLSGSTRFAHTNVSGQLEPAFFISHGYSQIWERQIASQPLLGTGRGPVLPVGKPSFTI